LTGANSIPAASTRQLSFVSRAQRSNADKFTQSA
jgi:hypothetical protein